MNPLCQMTNLTFDLSVILHSDVKMRNIRKTGKGLKHDAA